MLSMLAPPYKIGQMVATGRAADADDAGVLWWFPRKNLERGADDAVVAW